MHELRNPIARVLFDCGYDVKIECFKRHAAPGVKVTVVAYRPGQQLRGWGVDVASAWQNLAHRHARELDLNVAD